MGGIMRAPSRGAYFEIPYSGTLKYSDLILVAANGRFDISVVAQYSTDGWSHENYITNFSDENNVISFHMDGIEVDSSAALIPGPYHV